MAVPELRLIRRGGKRSRTDEHGELDGGTQIMTKLAEPGQGRMKKGRKKTGVTFPVVLVLHGPVAADGTQVTR